MVHPDGFQVLLKPDLATFVTLKPVLGPLDSFYLITLPLLGIVYCFDTKQQLQDGSSRVTTWNGISPKSFLYTADKQLLIGKEGYLG